MQVGITRADNAHVRNLGGTGLGLTIAKSMIELHGGSLELTSQFSVGTRVVVRMPATRVYPGRSQFEPSAQTLDELEGPASESA